MRRLPWLAVAVALWLPLLHRAFAPDRALIAAQLLEGQRRVWRGDGQARAVLRRSNPEWDLMHRLFTALALANTALAQPEGRAEDLALIDQILEVTLADEAAGGHQAFLLPYGAQAPFRDPRGRSLFVDGEVALMLAARQLVAPSPRWAGPLRERVVELERAFAAAPAGLPESYPDEGWTFCNTVALAALRAADVVEHRDHGPLFARWLTVARARLVDPRSGLLISSFHADGAPRDGPEGSTLWLAAHMLQVVAPDFARAQYDGARAQLGRSALGFAWAAEWPPSWRGPDDVDSGPTIPLVEANAGSSGLAVLGAAAFGDAEALDGLLASLAFAGFPTVERGARSYQAGNALADAVVLYALVQGPLWAELSRRRS